MDTKKPLVLTYGSDNSSFLSENFQVLRVPDLCASSPELGSVKGLVVWPTEVSRVMELLPHMTGLRAIVSAGKGYDFMEPLFEQCRERDITVGKNLGAEGSCEVVGDFAMGLLISSARLLVKGHTYLQTNKHSTQTREDWKVENFDTVARSIHVTKSTIGIVGLGTIGLEVAKRAHCGFSMNVLYHSRTQRSLEIESIVRAKFHPSLLTMLPLCDFVVICCDLNALSEGMFGMEEFVLMKPTSIIINIARGPIIKTEDLTVALEKKVIGGAALDCTSPEPLPPRHPLLDMDNVIITPHMGWTHQAWADDMNRSIQKVLESVILHNRKPDHVVNVNG